MKHVLVALVLTLALAACAGSSGHDHAVGGSPPPTAQTSPAVAASTPTAGGIITVREVNATGRGGAFEPEMLQVPVGSTVRWVNSSGNIHNVTFDDGSIRSSSVMSGADAYQYTFTRAGTYRYRCTFHPGMRGVVSVG